MDCNELVFSDHAIIQMFRRNISVEMVKQAISDGEIIADYPQDKPYPSYLLLGFTDRRPLHIVIAKSENLLCIVVTAYIPDESIWLDDYKTKK